MTNFTGGFMRVSRSIRFLLLPTLAAAGLFAGLAACSSEPTSKIPVDAMLVTQGDQQLSYRAPYDGTIYVWDASKDNIVYSGPVKRGQLIDVDLKNNWINVDNHRVSENNLYRGNRYSIYFKQEPQGTGTSTGTGSSGTMTQ
jgi:hypothetical protein